MKINRIKCLLSLLLVLQITISFAQNSILSGYIKDAETGEKLIGATVYDTQSKRVTITNNYGFYNLSIPTGSKVVVEVSYIGYQVSKSQIQLSKNTNLNINLILANAIDEVVITATKEKQIQRRTEMSIVSIPIKQIKALPAIGGESDIIKSLQLMPGIQSGNEGSSQLYVRGGSTDQNLILLDDVPMYYVSHLGGFVSTFNTDAINKVKIIKGGFPAIYGSRLSSVVDIRMKEGNSKALEGSTMIGMIASKISVEGPIKKDTTSYIISARRLLYDLVSRVASSIASKGKAVQGYHFYDINAKVNHHFSDNDHLYFSTYFGDDRNFYKTKQNDGDLDQDTNRTDWGNRLVALRWNHLFNQNLFSNTTLSYTRYRFSNENEATQTFDEGTQEIYSKFKSGIYDASAKIDFEYYTNPNYKLKFGTNLIHHVFNPGITSFKFEDNGEVQQDTLIDNQRLKALEGAIYLENIIKLGKKFNANLGLRYNVYRVNQQNFQSLEPRVLINYLVTDALSIKASYAEMQQNIHLLTTSGVGMPIDLWVPATKRVIPEKSKQYALGIAKTFQNKYEISLEGYYKELKNLTTYKEGATFANPTLNWQDKVEINGKGLGYGIELLVQKRQGKTTGWLGYTWSKTTRQFDNVNFGEIYPFRYDRRHDLSIVANHKITDNIDISATWVYGTGNAITLATSKYEMINTPPNSGYTYNWGAPVFSEVRYYSSKNGFRMRDFHKLDIGIRFHKKKKRGIQTWNLSIYNLYNRQNPYYYFFEEDYDNYEYDAYGDIIEESRELKLKQRSLFPIVPSVSYSFKF